MRRGASQPATKKIPERCSLERGIKIPKKEGNGRGTNAKQGQDEDVVFHEAPANYGNAPARTSEAKLQAYFITLLLSEPNADLHN